MWRIFQLNFSCLLSLVVIDVPVFSVVDIRLSPVSLKLFFVAFVNLDDVAFLSFVILSNNEVFQSLEMILKKHHLKVFKPGSFFLKSLLFQ